MKNQDNKNQATAPANSGNSSLQNFQTVFPGGITADKLFDDRIEKIIRLAAWDLTKDSNLFTKSDDDDIRQELRIHLLQKMPRFNPQKSSLYTYATLVCDRKCKNLIRNRIRELAKMPPTVSLNEVCNEEGETLADCVSADDYAMTFGGKSMPAATLADVREEIAYTLSQLSDKDRQICEMILGGMSMREISKTLKCPLSNLFAYFHNHTAAAFKAIYGGAR